MRAIDTNVLVRLITRDDDGQVASAEAYVSKGAWVSHLVLAETTWVLNVAYSLAPPEIATAVEMLLHHEQLTIQDSDTVQAALTHYRQKPALGFSDCLIVEIARKAGHVPVGSFDKALSRLNGVERL